MSSNKKFSKSFCDTKIGAISCDKKDDGINEMSIAYFEKTNYAEFFNTLVESSLKIVNKKDVPHGKLFTTDSQKQYFLHLSKEDNVDTFKTLLEKKIHPKKIIFTDKAYLSAIGKFRGAIDMAINHFKYERVDNSEKNSVGGRTKINGPLVYQKRTKHRISCIINLVINKINSELLEDKNLSEEDFIKFE